MRGRNCSFSINHASLREGMVVILMLSWDVWSLASLIQDLDVVDEKGVERTKIDDCSCPKYVP